MAAAGLATNPTKFARFCFLGTSSGCPTKYRNVSSNLVQFTNGKCWMFDCGEGTQHQLMRSPVKSGASLEKIFITHLHGDHCFGLPGLMCTMSNQFRIPDTEGEEVEGGEQEAPLLPDRPLLDLLNDPEAIEAPKGWSVIEVIGPFGVGALLRGNLRGSNAGLAYRFRLIELVPASVSGEEVEKYKKEQVAHYSELAPRFVHPETVNGCADVYNIAAPNLTDFTIRAVPLDHGGRIFCVGYVIQEPPSAGKFDLDKAKQLGVPSGPMFGQLKGGKSVTLPNGTVVTPDDVVGPPQEGRVLVHLGDTCNSDNVLSIARGANWIVHEATYDDAVGEKTATERGHSTATMAGRFARQLDAQLLIITHFSARYVPASGGDSTGEAIQELLEQAQNAYGGQVIAAHDFLTVDMAAKRA